MKYRVHLFNTYRDAYEVEAESHEEAMRKVVADPEAFLQTDHDFVDETSNEVLVDALLPDGEVDYESTVWLDSDKELP